jgi:receptor protein-tyrosine kinase
LSRRSEKKERNREAVSRGLVTLVDPTHASAEAYRALRTNLFYSPADPRSKVIVLTSPGPAEGKSTTCANLGVVLAQAGKSTLIIDCDLRKPVIHKAFELRNLYGVVNVLVGERTLQEVSHEPLAGLKVVPVGPVPPNPAELLGSPRFGDLIDQVRPMFDYVLIDSPPTGLVSDSAIIAAQADGVLLVLDAGATRKTSVRKAMRDLKTIGANVLGTVMNGVDPQKGGYYGYQYTYE